MDLGTMKQDIYETLHALVSKEKIQHRIIAAIRFHREKRLWFSERTFRFYLTAGRADYGPGDGYGLPDDLVEIVGENIWLTPAGSTGQRYPLRRVPSDSMEWERSIDTGQNEPYRWDYHANALRLQPIPNDAHLLEGRYVRDIGVPVRFYDTTAAAWAFKTPDGSEDLTDAYTSDWFDERGGYALIKHRALYDLFVQNLQDRESADAQLQLWLESTRQLEDESEGRTGPTEIVPRFW